MSSGGQISGFALIIDPIRGLPEMKSVLQLILPCWKLLLLTKRTTDKTPG